MATSLDTQTGLDFLIGPPLAIVGILVAAPVVTRIARRGLRRGLAKLGSGGLRERFAAGGSARLLADTGELSPRSTVRVEALSTVLRSVVSFAVWTMALFLVLRRRCRAGTGCEDGGL